MRQRRQKLVVLGAAVFGSLLFGSVSAAGGGDPATTEVRATSASAASVTRAPRVGARATSEPVLAVVDPTTTATSEPAPTTSTTQAPAATTTAAPTTTTAPPPPTPPPPPAPSGTVEEAIRRWFGDVYDRAYDVARCESGLDPSAVSAGGGNHGLFQINNVHRDSFARVTGVAFEDGRYDADLNSQFARWLYDQQGWSPWTCA